MFEKVSTTVIFDILDNKISGFEETKNKLDRMKQYRLSGEVNFAILTMEEIKEDIERRFFGGFTI